MQRVGLILTGHFFVFTFVCVGGGVGALMHAHLSVFSWKTISPASPVVKLLRALGLKVLHNLLQVKRYSQEAWLALTINISLFSTIAFSNLTPHFLLPPPVSNRIVMEWKRVCTSGGLSSPLCPAINLLCDLGQVIAFNL